MMMMNSISMRRRHTAPPLADAAEKGQWDARYSRICLLASFFLFFWIFLIYFNFMVFRGNHVANISNTSQLESYSIYFDSRKSLPTDPNANPSLLTRSLNAHRSGFDSGREKVLDNVSRHESPNPTKNGDPKPLANADKPVEMKKSYPFMRALRTVKNKSDPCGGRYVYVHNLPSMFNEDMLKNCKHLNPWINMCKYVTGGGLGPPLMNDGLVFSRTSWYATNQFALDVIFTNRMKQYECLTNDSSVAAAIFVPFYAGLDIARYLWGNNTIATRDATSLALINWLMKKPEWQIMGGRDHFFVGGRITWDFRRTRDEEWDWGNKLLFLPATKNMTMLVIEASPWGSNDYAIPYPTYFHPAKDSDVIHWQHRMRKLRRRNLFCFAGAPRPANNKSIRSHIINQCNKSSACKLLECNSVGGNVCYAPSNIMKMFQSSVFCLQPQGDSYTRRSTFDAMLAGCIPVFFHPGSAYTQYTWHLPKDYTQYSVLIPENNVRSNVSIEERLRKIPAEKAKQMREVVINLIPKMVYADPRFKLNKFKDAFDVTVEAVIEKVTKLRKDLVEGRKERKHVEELSWKYAMMDEDEVWKPHEWDPFFSKTEEEKSGS